MDIEQFTKADCNTWHLPCKPPAKNTLLNSNAKCAPRYGGLVSPLGVSELFEQRRIY